MMITGGFGQESQAALLDIRSQRWTKLPSLLQGRRKVVRFWFYEERCTNTTLFAPMQDLAGQNRVSKAFEINCIYEGKANSLNA